LRNCNNSFRLPFWLAATASLAHAAGPICLPIHSPSLSSPCQSYSLKLRPLHGSPSAALGAVVKVQINGGPVLNLLLDSGAQDIAVTKRVAKRLGLPGESDMKLVGLGASLGSARRLAPGRLEADGLILDNCPMLATDARMREGSDGILPLALFAGFLVKLDVPRQTLELTPYPEEEPQDAGGFTPARADQRMLFLQATVNRTAAGYLLLDTGSAYNGVSPAAATAWRNYRLLSPTVPLTGTGGDTDGFLLPPGVRFQVGAHEMRADPAVVVDLSAISRLHQFEVSGVIGYPAIRYSVVTIDYRDARVRMEGK